MRQCSCWSKFCITEPTISESVLSRLVSDMLRENLFFWINGPLLNTNTIIKIYVFWRNWLRISRSDSREILSIQFDAPGITSWQEDDRPPFAIGWWVKMNPISDKAFIGGALVYSPDKSMISMTRSSSSPCFSCFLHNLCQSVESRNMTPWMGSWLEHFYSLESVMLF